MIELNQLLDKLGILAQGRTQIIGDGQQIAITLLIVEREVVTVGLQAEQLQLFHLFPYSWYHS